MSREISECTQCHHRHIVSESCEAYKERLGKEFKSTTSLIESGYAGVNSKGTIIDRRVEKGVPIPENPLFNTPKPKPVKDIEVIGMVDVGKTTTDVLEKHLNKPGNNKVVVVGAGVDSCFPNLPAELRDKVEFVEDISEVSKLKKEDINTLLKEAESLKYTNLYDPRPYDDSPTRSKYKAGSNKKYVKRKKAKNGRTKKRRK